MCRIGPFRFPSGVGLNDVDAPLTSSGRFDTRGHRHGATNAASVIRLRTVANGNILDLLQRIRQYWARIGYCPDPCWHARSIAEEMARKCVAVDVVVSPHHHTTGASSSNSSSSHQHHHHHAQGQGQGHPSSSRNIVLQQPSHSKGLAIAEERAKVVLESETIVVLLDEATCTQRITQESLHASVRLCEQYWRSVSTHYERVASHIHCSAGFFGAVEHAFLIQSVLSFLSTGCLRNLACCCRFFQWPDRCNGHVCITEEVALCQLNGLGRKQEKKQGHGNFFPACDGSGSTQELTSEPMGSQHVDPIAAALGAELGFAFPAKRQQRPPPSSTSSSSSSRDRHLTLHAQHRPAKRDSVLSSHASSTSTKLIHAIGGLDTEESSSSDGESAKKRKRLSSGSDAVVAMDSLCCSLESSQFLNGSPADYLDKHAHDCTPSSLSLARPLQKHHPHGQQNHVEIPCGSSWNRLLFEARWRAGLKAGMQVMVLSKTGTPQKWSPQTIRSVESNLTGWFHRHKRFTQVWDICVHPFGCV
jgi:hypothetical protein